MPEDVNLNMPVFPTLVGYGRTWLLSDGSADFHGMIVSDAPALSVSGPIRLSDEALDSLIEQVEARLAGRADRAVLLATLLEPEPPLVPSGRKILGGHAQRD